MSPETYIAINDNEICFDCKHCDSHPFTPYCYRHDFICDVVGWCPDFKDSIRR